MVLVALFRCVLWLVDIQGLLLRPVTSKVPAVMVYNSTTGRHLLLPGKCTWLSCDMQ